MLEIKALALTVAVVVVVELVEAQQEAEGVAAQAAMSK